MEQTQSFGNIKTGFRNLNINVVICICMDLLISNILLYNDILCFFFIFWEIVDDRLEGPVCLSESEMSDQMGDVRPSDIIFPDGLLSRSLNWTWRIGFIIDLYDTNRVICHLC